MQADAAARGNLPEIIRNAGAAGCKDIHLDDFNLSNGGKDLISDATLMLAFGRRYGLIGRNGTGERVESSSSWGRHWGRLFIEARMMSWRWGLRSDLWMLSHQSSFLSPVLPSPLVMPGGFAWAWRVASVLVNVICRYSRGQCCHHYHHPAGKTTLLRALALHDIKGIPRNCQVRVRFVIQTARA